MAHENEELLRTAYKAFDSGDMDALNELIAEDHVVHMPGNNLVSGDYRGKQEAFGVFGKLAELTGGTYRNEQVHGIAANDHQGVAVVTSTAERDGKTLRASEVHVFNLRNGKTVEFWAHPYDLQAWNAFWS